MPPSQQLRFCASCQAVYTIQERTRVPYSTQQLSHALKTLDIPIGIPDFPSPRTPRAQLGLFSPQRFPCMRALARWVPASAKVHSVNEHAKVPRWQAQAKRREAQRESANLHNIFCCFFLACSMPWRAPPFLGTHTERAFNSCLSLSAVSPESARACCVLRASEPSCWEEEARRCSRSLGVLILSRSFANQVGFGFFHARCPLRCAAYSKRICTCC